MTERTYKDYEELAQLLEDAETAVARVQGKLIDMFPVEAVDEGYPDYRHRRVTMRWRSMPH